MVDCVQYIRRGLVPGEYEPHPFRRDTPESHIDQLRSIVATYIFRDTIEKLYKDGNITTL